MTRSGSQTPAPKRGFPARSDQCSSDTRLIVEGHRAQEAALTPQARRVLFFDTDLISTCIYNRYYFGACPAWLERLSRERSADLYLLTDTDIPWSADPGQRDGPAIQAALHTLFRDELQARGVAHVLVSGSLTQRMEIAVRAVDGLLASPVEG